MDAARQVVRWSIPGWVFLLILIMLQILTRLGQGNSWNSIVTSPLMNSLSLAAVALVVTAGIPLGFIIYQVYYSWYGRVLVFNLVNRDRGAEVLLSLPEDIRDNLLVVDGHFADLEDPSGDLSRSFGIETGANDSGRRSKLTGTLCGSGWIMYVFDMKPISLKLR